MTNTSSTRTWFCVLNNPEKQFGQIEPDKIVDKAIEVWMTADNRGCAINYEIGDVGKTPHLHMVLYDPAKVRFTAIKKLFPAIHVEPMHGTKKQALEYIEKKGRFEEKNHTVIIPAKYAGDIQSNQGQRTDLSAVQDMIDSGMKPNEIFDENILFRKYEKIIKSAYFRKRTLETPPFRNVDVTWHCGEAGTGESHSYLELVEQYGEDDVYFVSDFENGGLDNYAGEHILFLDEYKGSYRYQIFLQMLDGYKAQIHCRYANAYALWTAIHITSIYPPEQSYTFMVDESARSLDSVQQLLRRINTIVYHYKENSEYKSFALPALKYVNYEDLKQRALGDKNGFMTVDDKDIPFQ